VAGRALRQELRSVLVGFGLRDDRHEAARSFVVAANEPLSDRRRRAGVLSWGMNVVHDQGLPMNHWKTALREGAVAGTVATFLSTALLAAIGQRENASAAAPVNAVSHWLWGD